MGRTPGCGGGAGEPGQRPRVGAGGGVSARSITVRVPLAIHRRPGRKMVITPDGAPVPTRADPALVKALARAFRWKRMLEDGRHGSISEIASAEKIDRGYVGSVLRLTLLAPDIVEGVMNGRLTEVTLPQLLEPWPVEWDQQRRKLLCR